MKFEVPFNVENNYQENLFLWKYTWLKKVRLYGVSILILTGPFMLILVSSNQGFSYVLLMVFCLSAMMANAGRLFAIGSYKRKYLANVKKRSESLAGTLIVYEFTDDRLSYTDDLLSYHIKWSEIEKFVSSPNILLIKQTYHHSANIIISRHEFGEEAYSEIVGFLKTKLPQESF